MSLSSDRTRPLELGQSLAEVQARAWSRLAGRWISEIPVEEEVAHVYEARTGGREIDL